MKPLKRSYYNIQIINTKENYFMYGYNMSSTIILNNIFLVKMNLKYIYDYGFGGVGGSEGLRIELKSQLY